MALGLKPALCFVAFQTRFIRNNTVLYRSMSSLINREELKPNHILSLIDGFRYSKVLFTAVDLKLFDHLISQSLSLEELANKLNLSHTSTLERFLAACMALKLIQRNQTNNQYSNTQLSEKYLVSTSPTTLNEFIHMNNQSSYLMWNHLSNSIRENTSRTMKEDQFSFDRIYRDENIETRFISAMHGLGLTCFPSIIASLDDIHRYKTFCDLGGATGYLAVSACEVNPHLQAIVYDLPCIEKHAVGYMNKLPLDIRNRIHFRSGNFFVDSLPQVDLVGLGRILHDWKDEQCEQLLRKIYRILPEQNGAILIAEKLFDEDKTGPIEVNMQDINMLLATAGRERTSTEYTYMLEKVGFRDIKCQRTGAYLDAIIGYK